MSSTENKDGRVPAAPERPLEAGAAFGRYQIRALISKSDSVAVYEARDIALNRSVTLRVYPANVPVEAARSTAEAGADVGIENGRAFSAMPIASGAAAQTVPSVTPTPRIAASHAESRVDPEAFRKIAASTVRPMEKRRTPRWAPAVAVAALLIAAVAFFRLAKPSVNTGSRATQASDSRDSDSSVSKSTANNDGITLPDDQPSNGQYYALLIGINHYRTPDGKPWQEGDIPELKAPINDAQEVAKVLRDEFGFHLIGWDTKAKRLKMDAAPDELLFDADRPEILSALKSLQEAVPSNSNLLIYYAGHGNYIDKYKEGYWIPADGAVEGNPISAHDVAVRLGAITQAKHILVVSDSCYSKDMMDEAGSRLVADNVGTAVHKEVLNDKDSVASRTWLTSGSHETVKDRGGDGDHSPFETAFVTSLRKMKQLSQATPFTGTELFNDYLQDELKRTLHGENKQKPNYQPAKQSHGGDFVFRPRP